jgi:Domain of unknown function (DUF4915)
MIGLSDSALFDKGASLRMPHPRAEPPLAPSARKGAIKVQTQFSGGFGDWLIRHRVGLVGSTYQTGHLLFIGARADGRPVPSEAGFSRAMGIVAFSQRIYVGTKTEIWRLENVLRADELDNDIFDRLYAPRNVVELFDVGVVANVRCPRGLGQSAAGLDEVISGEEMRA